MTRTALSLLTDLLRLLRLTFQSRARLAAENLLLRKQLACYIERNVRPRRADNPTRVTLVLLSRFVAWRELLTSVHPDTLVRWHRDLYRLVWRAKSRPRGRPRIPVELRRVIAAMAAANRTWGEERIAAELRLKLGLTVSPRTVRRYMPSAPRPRGPSLQSWTTFIHNHAGAVLACDFLVVVTATFQRLYVFALFDIATRRVVHWNVTAHPTATWTIQQFRNGLPPDRAYRFIIHDRDGIFAPAVDDALRSMSLEVLKTPVRAPQANAYCERFIGTARRECLDWIIPLSERHLRRVLAEWIPHYNRERPHAALGPGLPDAPNDPTAPRRLDIDCRQAVASWPALVWEVCTMTTNWNPSPHEFLRSTAHRPMSPHDAQSEPLWRARASSRPVPTGEAEQHGAVRPS